MSLHREIHYSATCDVCKVTSPDLVTGRGWFERAMGMDQFARNVRALGWQVGSGYVVRRMKEKRHPDVCPDCIAAGKGWK